MKKSAIVFFAVQLFCFTSLAISQVLNVFNAPTGMSGVGPGLTPLDLFHIHGWLPNPLSPYPIYKDPVLRISLETPGTGGASPIYGQLAMQNTDEFSTGIIPRHFSTLAKKYDFVLTTTETFEPAFFSGLTSIKPYTYDLILSTKSPLASMRFATTPSTMPPGAFADVERMTITNDGKVGINQSTPTQLLEVKSGNVLISNPGTVLSPGTAGQLQFQGTATGVTTFKAGAQGATNFNFTLPITTPNANSLLFTPNGGTTNAGLSWTNAGTNGQIFTVIGGFPSWQNPSAFIGSYVLYDVTAPQNVSLTRTHNLFDVEYGSSANDANAAGAIIKSVAGATNRSSTGLTITSTSSGSGTSTGLKVAAGGNTSDPPSNFAAVFTGGNVGIGTNFPEFAEMLNIHYVDDGNTTTPRVAPYPAIKLSLGEGVPTDNSYSSYYHSLTLALCPGNSAHQGYYGGRKLDGVLCASAGDLILATNKAPADWWASLRINDDGGAIRFKTNSARAPITGVASPVEAMTIISSGNVGVSNTAPTGLFQVGSNFLTVLSSGNVGVSNTTPTGLFQVGSNFLTVLSSGNVGVSNTTPTGLFQVGSNSLTVLSNGRTGIGTTTPNRLLQIGDRITFNSGGWSGMQYNTDDDGKRIFDGTAAAVFGIPVSTPPVTTWDAAWAGGITMSANPFALAGATTTTGHNLWLSTGKLELWGGPDGPSFRITNPVASFADPGLDHTKDLSAVPGWTYIRYKTLIGTEGIGEPSYPSTAHASWFPGKLDLTGLSTTFDSPMLAVNGLVLCKELLVKTTSPIPWPDYVFQKDYKLMSLADLEKSTKETMHLPDLPSAQEIESGGINVTDIETKLVKKVEELTLYVIQQDKRIKALEAENQKLQK